MLVILPGLKGNGLQISQLVQYEHDNRLLARCSQQEQSVARNNTIK